VFDSPLGEMVRKHLYNRRTGRVTVLLLRMRGKMFSCR
jgi:hypothetical protein